MRFPILFSLFLLSLSACRPDQQSRVQQTLQHSLDSLQQATGIAGISVAVILPDEKGGAAASGMADQESRVALTPRDRLLMGSVGKLFVATLILQEVEAGRLGLEDSVTQYFPTSKGYAQLPNANDITVRQLLNHTSGLPRWVFKPIVWQSMLDDPERTWTLEERLAIIAGDSALHPAGKGWDYSDTNYLLLGAILEQLNGKPFYEQVEEKLLLPFDLKEIAPSDQRYLRGLAAGYTGTRNPFGFPEKVAEEGLYVVNPQFEWTGGGFMTTPTGLARFIRLLYGGEFLSPVSLQAMQTPVLYRTGLPGEATYGLACMIRETPLGVSYGHGGFMPGFQTEVNHYARAGLTVVLMVNEDQFGGRHSGPLINWADLLAEKVATLIGEG